MKSKFLPALVLAIGLAGASASSQAVVLEVQDWGLNINGTTYCNFGLFFCNFDAFNAPGADPVANLPGSVDALGFDFDSGLGTLDISLSGAASYSILSFFDFEILEATNTFFNEFGEAVGTPGDGQSFELDEIGLVFGDLLMDANFEPGNFFQASLDNSVSIGPSDFPDDVAMAIGWDFVLGDNQSASVSFSVLEDAPLSGFYLRQADADSGDEVFFTSSLSITGQTNPIPGTDPGGPVAVPTPGTAASLALGLVALFATARLRSVG